MIHFFVGPMGCGKSYVAKKLSAEWGCDFIEGDDFVPSEMIKRVSQFKPLGQASIDDYIYNHLIPGVEAHYRTRVAQETSADLVVAQALYRKEHRDAIRDHFKDITPCSFTLVRAPLLTNLKRLYQRPKGLRWALYGLWNLLFFQTSGVTKIIDN